MACKDAREARGARVAAGCRLQAMEPPPLGPQTLEALGPDPGVQHRIGRSIFIPGQIVTPRGTVEDLWKRELNSR
jgi:hypothetical protein